MKTILSIKFKDKNNILPYFSLDIVDQISGPYLIHESILVGLFVGGEGSRGLILFIGRLRRESIPRVIFYMNWIFHLGNAEGWFTKLTEGKGCKKPQFSIYVYGKIKTTHPIQPTYVGPFSEVDSVGWVG